MIKIEHIAIWVRDLEESRRFYMKYFNAESSEKYENPHKNFTSYFLSFGSSACRIELMNNPILAEAHEDRSFSKGLTHLAISTGSKLNVDKLTEKLRADDFIIKSEARTTGDGYYESVVLDPEGNIIEICE